MRRIRDKRWAQETAEKNKMWYRKDEEIKQLKVVDQNKKKVIKLSFSIWQFGDGVALSIQGCLGVSAAGAHTRKRRTNE